MRIAIAVFALVLAGCAGSSTSHSTGGDDSTSPPTTTITSPPTTTATGNRRFGWKPLITLHQLGTIRTRCLGKKFATAFTASIATERARVVGIPQERPFTLQPGQTRYSPLSRTRRVVWRISQATEPQTITATVSISPSRCPYGVPRTHVTYGSASFNSR
jgi:hypothetical protein